MKSQQSGLIINKPFRIKFFMDMRFLNDGIKGSLKAVIDGTLIRMTLTLVALSFAEKSSNN